MYVDPMGLCKEKFGECWVNCMENYPFINIALSLTPAGLLNLKTPFDIRQPGASWWTSIDRRLGFPIEGRGAFVRIAGGRAKYLGYGGTLVAATTAFGVGYFIGAAAYCTGQCLAE